MANKDNATPARAGKAYSALASAITTIPTSASTPTPAGLITAGYEEWGELGKDGITIKIDGEETSIENWDGSEVQTWSTKHTMELTIRPLEMLTAAVAKEFFGEEAVTVDSDGNVTSIAMNNASVEDRTYVFDCKTITNKLARLVIPRGKATTSKEVAFNSTNAMGGEITIKCLDDDDGNKGYMYFAEPTPPTSPTS